MSLIGWIIVLFVVSIICRLLRSLSEVVDYIAYLIVLAAFIIVWINAGFWFGLLAGFVGMIAIYLLFGIGSGTEVKKFGRKYTLSCKDCGYDDLEILEENEVGVCTRCKRCGKVCFYTLNH